MKQLELMVTLLDAAIEGIERGRIEDLLDAQYAIYGVASGAAPAEGRVDLSVLLLADYCLERLTYGRRDEEWAAADVLKELRKGFQQALAQGPPCSDVQELIDVSA